MREKLAELIGECKWWCVIEDMADHLIANGVVVREKGEWVEKPFLLGTTNICNKCGEYYGMPHGKYNFCPNCGADMRKGEN